ncbi:MAG: FimB/Mfa2 family fimbrial subunit [Sphingobacteriales bacterium]
MKRYIFSLIAIMVVFSACKKDAVNKSTPNSKSVPVTFNVGYSQSVGSFNGARNLAKLTGHNLAADSTLKANAKTLYVGVYQSDGNQLFLTKQLSTDTSFGKMNFNLPAGNYTVVFAAGQENLFMSGSTLSRTDIVYSVEVGNGNFDRRWHSTFFQKINLTVGSTGVVQNISLNRIDAQIVIDIEDAIPSNVKFLFAQVTDNKSQGGANNTDLVALTGAPALGSNDGLLYVRTNSDTAVTPGTKNTRFCVTLLDTSNPYTVSIYAYDQLPLVTSPGGNRDFSPMGNIIGFFTTSTVTVQTGHQTILSGKLFGGNGTTNTGGFQMTVNPTWDPTTTTIPFQ